MKNKKFLLTFYALLLVGLTAGGVSAYAASQDDTGSGFLGRFKHSFQKDDKKMEQIQQAMTAGDYAAWKALMGDNKLTEVITADNFAKFVQMHQLMRDGQMEQAKQLREELGLPDEPKGPLGERDEQCQEKFQNREQIQQAIENGDYNSWKELVGDNPITQKIIADNFAQFVEMHQLLKDKKFAEAEQIAQGLGLPEVGPGREGGRHGFGFGHQNENLPNSQNSSDSE